MGCEIGLTAKHNTMVARVVVLLCLAVAKGVWWSLEQPKGSQLEYHHLFQAFLKLLKRHGMSVRRTSTSLGWFGGETKKPLWIYSSFLASNGYLFHYLIS